MLRCQPLNCRRAQSCTPPSNRDTQTTTNQQSRAHAIQTKRVYCIIHIALCVLLCHFICLGCVCVACCCVASRANETPIKRRKVPLGPHRVHTRNKNTRQRQQHHNTHKHAQQRRQTETHTQGHIENSRSSVTKASSRGERLGFRLQPNRAMWQVLLYAIIGFYSLLILPLVAYALFSGIVSLFTRLRSLSPSSSHLPLPVSSSCVADSSLRIDEDGPVGSPAVTNDLHVTNRTRRTNGYTASSEDGGTKHTRIVTTKRVQVTSQTLPPSTTTSTTLMLRDICVDPIESSTTMTHQPVSTMIVPFEGCDDDSSNHCEYIDSKSMGSHDPTHSPTSAHSPSSSSSMRRTHSQTPPPPLAATVRIHSASNLYGNVDDDSDDPDELEIRALEEYFTRSDIASRPASSFDINIDTTVYDHSLLRVIPSAPPSPGSDIRQRPPELS